MSTEQADTTPEPVGAQAIQVAHLRDAWSLRGERDHQGVALDEPVSAHERQPDSGATVRRLIAMIAVLGAALAVAAFTLSFDALRELATISGLNPTLAWLWPLIVDGFILIATAAAVALRDRGRKVTWYPWATLILFSTISVAGNALHASNHADHTAVTVTVAAAVSAVPALALLLASHLMVVLLGPPNSSSRTSGAETRERVNAFEQPAKCDTQAAPVSAQVAPSSTSSHMPTSTTTTKSLPRTVDVDLRTWVHAENAAGRTVTGAAVAERLGVSPATGRRRLAALRQEDPVDLPSDLPRGKPLEEWN